MNEKSCLTCRCACKGRNLIGFTCWQPKEEKMRKPIFESEDEARECFKVIGFGLGKGWMDQLKQAGYIHLDPIEEAEEMWERYNGSHDVDMYRLIEKQHEAIQLMKPYYEKHKGEKL